MLLFTDLSQVQIYLKYLNSSGIVKVMSNSFNEITSWIIRYFWVFPYFGDLRSGFNDIDYHEILSARSTPINL